MLQIVVKCVIFQSVILYNILFFDLYKVIIIDVN